MRGGQPPLAPKSSHKVLRSFPPPHRLRGKPLKIPKKPRPPTVIPALATHNNHVTAKLRQKSWQSTTSCHCEEPVQGDVAVVYILSLRGAKRRGNPLTCVHFLDCFASLAMTVFFTLAKTVHKKNPQDYPEDFLSFAMDGDSY